MKTLPGKKGFTIMELSLYFTITAVLMLALISFSGNILNLSNKSIGMQEIITNLDYITQKITSTAKFASDVNTNLSIFNNNIGAISFIVENPSNSPTTFRLFENDIYLKEGNNAEKKISSENIKCSIFQFEMITTSKMPDSISYEITCKPNYEDPLNKLPEITIKSQISLINE